MRRNKHKHTRRAVTFYKLNFGFHEPFKVLLDGNFIHAAISINLGELEVHLSKLLGARVKLYVTRCVTRELQGMGEGMGAALAAARACDLHKCGHAPGECTTAECLLQQIGQENPDRWWVATQDAALRAQLDQVPGCPLIFATINGIHLHEPHGMDRSTAKQAAVEHQALPEHERQSEVLKDLEAIRPRLKTSAAFRRKKAKGPNPLSVKKKATKAQPALRQPEAVTSPSSHVKDAAANALGEAKRKRKRHKQGSPAPAASGFS